MPEIRVSHFYKQHPPGSVVDVSEDEAKRIVAGRGGKLVETATDKAVERAEVEADEPAVNDAPPAVEVATPRPRRNRR